MSSNQEKINRAKQLRQQQTKAEGLLWSVLRSKQLCGLKFRRQHPIGPFFADFACVKHRIIIELDGGYHDEIQEADIKRQEYLKSQGWRVVRFENEVVLDDVDRIAQAIAAELGFDYEYKKRKATLGAMLNKMSGKKRG